MRAAGEVAIKAYALNVLYAPVEDYLPPYVHEDWVLPGLLGEAQIQPTQDSMRKYIDQFSVGAAGPVGWITHSLPHSTVTMHTYRGLECSIQGSHAQC